MSCCDDASQGLLVLQLHVALKGSNQPQGLLCRAAKNCSSSAPMCDGLVLLFVWFCLFFFCLVWVFIWFS